MIEEKLESLVEEVKRIFPDRKITKIKAEVKEYGKQNYFNGMTYGKEDNPDCPIYSVEVELDSVTESKNTVTPMYTIDEDTLNSVIVRSHTHEINVTRDREGWVKLIFSKNSNA